MKSKPDLIHPTAVISSKAELGSQVEVGPYAIIGDHVQIGSGSVVMHHGIVDKNTRIGKKCKIFPFASIGTDPQDITFKGEDTFVEIGDNNVFREFTTINRGTLKGGGMTRLGNSNYLMAYSHIAHDCQLGSNIIITNGATLAGHVEVDDCAVISAFSSVHQFVHIGRNAYIGGYTIVLQDILPFAKVSQGRDSYNFYGPNSIGMMRNGFSREFIENVKEVFRIVFQSDLNTSQAIARLQDDMGDTEEAHAIIRFIEKSKRGILKNFKSDK
jgi:UDP-N-acetylglucosamine acyltransferase